MGSELEKEIDRAEARLKILQDAVVEMADSVQVNRLVIHAILAVIMVSLPPRSDVVHEMMSLCADALSGQISIEKAQSELRGLINGLVAVFHDRDHASEN